jgi:hypothetical protein
MARYKVVDGSVSQHCCFEATVVDTSNNESLCECFDKADAHKIAIAMNAFAEAIA